MKTLKEISASNPSTYKVVDYSELKMRVKTWHDPIAIVINHKYYFYKRKACYKVGLCTGIK